MNGGVGSYSKGEPANRMVFGYGCGAEGELPSSYLR